MTGLNYLLISIHAVGIAMSPSRSLCAQQLWEPKSFTNKRFMNASARDRGDTLVETPSGRCWMFSR
jgi:hypothetical protein